MNSNTPIPTIELSGIRKARINGQQHAKKANHRPAGQFGPSSAEIRESRRAEQDRPASADVTTRPDDPAFPGHTTGVTGLPRATAPWRAQLS